MKQSILFVAMSLIWIDFLLAIYHRFVQMPKWISNPPTSFEIMRRERARANSFQKYISILFLAAAVFGLILNWHHEDARSHIVASFICFLLAMTLNSIFYSKDTADIQSEVESAQSLLMIKKIKSWMRWSLVIDFLLFASAGFISIAWNHV